MIRRLPSRLYAIADGAGGRDVVALTARFLEGGVRIVQLRWKDAPTVSLHEAAMRCRQLTRERGAFLIVNDRVDVAVACDADGVHLGQSDLPPAAARPLLAAGRWIGVSTHDERQALAAAAAGADYIGFGPLFPTGTKATGYEPRGIEQLTLVRRAVSLPIVAIGGITAERAPSAIDAGADAVAVISALGDAPDPARAARELLALLGEESAA